MPRGVNAKLPANGAVNEESEKLRAEVKVRSLFKRFKRSVSKTFSSIAHSVICVSAKEKFHIAKHSQQYEEIPVDRSPSRH
jgi:hypothetical protein